MKSKTIQYYFLFSFFIIILFVSYIYTSYNQEKKLVSERTIHTSFIISEWIKSSFNASDYILQDIINTVPVTALKYPALDSTEHERISRYIDAKRKTLPNSNGIGL